MNLDAFKSFSDDAPLWIYAFGKPLDEDGRRVTEEVLSAFLSTWHSHNVDVDGAFAVVHDRFVILTAASRGSVSGCSLDSVSVTFKSLRNQHGLDALDGSLVHYRDGDDTIRSCNRETFKAEVAAGRCGSGTIVFDLTVGTLDGLRAGRFEVPLADSWHADAFLTT